MEKKKTSIAHRKRATRYNVTQMDMALLEYVRSGGSSWEAEKITQVHHTAVQRAWDALSEEERNEYRNRAKDVYEAVTEQIFQKEVAVVSEITIKLKEISDLALDELRDRLKDELRRTEVKDADLITIATKCLALAENKTSNTDDNSHPNSSVVNIYNILDNSIQENLQLNVFKHEE